MTITKNYVQEKKDLMVRAQEAVDFLRELSILVGEEADKAQVKYKGRSFYFGSHTMRVCLHQVSAYKSAAKRLRLVFPRCEIETSEGVFTYEGEGYYDYKINIYFVRRRIVSERVLSSIAAEVGMKR